MARRSRIRIGPGGMVYVVVTLLILGAAIYTQANLLFWAFGLMVGGLIVSLVLSVQMLRGVSIQRLPPAHGVAGEMLLIRYSVVNRSWLPVFGLVIHETWGPRRWFGEGYRRSGPIADRPRRLAGRPFGWVQHIGPHQTIQAEAPCWPLRRGHLDFERIVISSSFPFGVTRKIVEVDQPGRVLVYPPLFRFNRRVLFKLSQVDPGGRKRVEKAGGAEEFFGLREYRSGDSPRMIDWKHSARMGTLIAREMTHPSPPRIMLLLDLSAPPAKARGPTPAARGIRQALRRRLASPAARDKALTAADPVEQAICLAASLVCDAHFHGYQIGMAVLGVAAPTFPVHHSLPHRTKMLEALSTLDVTLRRAAEPMMNVPPSVIIRPGGGGRGGGDGRATVLTTADIDQYITMSPGGTLSLLSRRPVRLSRRQELAAAG